MGSTLGQTLGQIGLDTPWTDSPVCPALWGAVTEDSGCSVLILRVDGEVRFANRTAVDRFGGGAEEIAGQPLHELLPRNVANEYRELARLSTDHGGVIHVRGMLRGVLCITSIRPLPSVESHALIVSRPCLSAAQVEGDGGPRVLRARFDDRGSLESLTARELQVLKYIGMGMSTAAIAEELHRSVKTIEWHRVSLGNKLQVSNRVELARIAINAGLAALDDAGAVEDSES